MIAAVYARKSTDQSGVSDEQKSVARQIDHARQYARRKGWRIDDDCIFVDDGIGGAEFAARPGFVRLMTALKPAPRFQALIMSEESRLGREQLEVGYALKQIISAEVRVFCYLTDTERRLDSPIEKAMLALQTMSDEMERVKASQRVTDVMLRKARAGHVTGGRVFGFRNVPVLGPDGKRSHVKREKVDAEVKVIRRIFKLSGDEMGLSTIARTLNAERARAPLAQQNRPHGWSPSSVREVLHRELYRGVIVYNRTRKRDRWGQINPEDRAGHEWVRVTDEHLRIVSDEEWARAHAHLDDVRDKYRRANNGQLLGGRPVGTGTPKYLLTGLLVCGVCGASLEGRTRSHGRLRAPFYGCTAHRRKGSSICANNFEIPMRDADHAVLSTIEHVMADSSVLEDIVACALEELAPKDESEEQASDDPRARLQRERADLDRQLAHLAAAIAEGGGDLSTVLAEIRTRERRRRDVLRALATTDASNREQPTEGGIRAALTAMLAEWRALLRSHTEDGQRLVRRLIEGRLTVMPERDAEGRFYRWSGSATLSPLLAGMRPHMVASPTGFEPVFWP